MPTSNAFDVRPPRARRGRRWFAPGGKAEWIISLSLLAYPLLGTLIAFTSLPSLVASTPVRALVLLLSLSLIRRTPRAVWASTGARLMFVFWAMYLIRLLWDGWIVGIPVAGEFTFNFVAFCIPTAMALMHAPSIDERRLSLQLLALSVVTCVLAIVAANTGLAGARSFTEDAEGRLFLDTVNPITFGHVGVTTVLAALSMTRFCTRKIEWAALAAAAALGCVAIQLAGSRGPLVALLVCVLAAALLVRRYRWLVLPLIAGGLLMFGGSSTDTQSLLASRVTESALADSPEIRVLMAAGAFQQFLDSPWLGSAIIELQFEDYPHNPFLEAAMAIGIGGLLVLLAINLIALRRMLRALRHGVLLVPLLALQALVAAQVSGSLAASAPVWMFLALFAAAAERRRRRLRKRRRNVRIAPSSLAIE